MSRLYADENFDDGVVQELRRLGHDVTEPARNDFNTSRGKASDIIVGLYLLSLSSLSKRKWNIGL